MAKKAKVTTYVVSDGDLVLHLTPAEKGWFAVSTPLDPHVHTQAKTIEEAFEMARDAIEALRVARKKHFRKMERAMAS